MSRSFNTLVSKRSTYLLILCACGTASERVVRANKMEQSLDFLVSKWSIETINTYLHKKKIKSREDKKNTKSKLQCRTLLILLCEGNSKRQAVVNMFLYMLMSLQLLYVCAAIDCWSFAGVVYSPLLLLFPAVVIKVRRCSKPNANALPLSASKTMLKHSTWQTKTKQRTCNNNTAVLAIKEMQQQSICMFFALIACYFCSRCPSLSIGNWGMAEKSMKSMQLNFEICYKPSFSFADDKECWA